MKPCNLQLNGGGLIRCQPNGVIMVPWQAQGGHFTHLSFEHLWETPGWDRDMNKHNQPLVSQWHAQTSRFPPVIGWII